MPVGSAGESAVGSANAHSTSSSRRRRRGRSTSGSSSIGSSGSTSNSSDCRREPRSASDVCQGGRGGAGLHHRELPSHQAAGVGSPAARADSRQEALARCLSEVTQLKLSDKGLSPDFRLQLQLLECSMQQYRLMQKVADQQQKTCAQLEELHLQGLAERQTLVLQRTEMVQQDLEQVKFYLEQQYPSGLLPEAGDFAPGYAPGADAVPDGCCSRCGEPTAGPPCGEKNASVSPADVSLEMPQERTGTGNSGGKSPRSGAGSVDDGRRPLVAPPFQGTKEDPSAAPGRADSPARACVRSVDMSDDEDVVLAGDSILSKLIINPYFETVCGFVIVCNAATIGIAAQGSIQWAMNNIGNRKESYEKPALITRLGLVYLAFYVFELCMRFLVWGRKFFTCASYKWNLFDLLLVLTGIYDVATEYMPGLQKNQSGGSIAWMRVLRLLKMLKLLRVVRVMRFFKKLRMMVNSIGGSIMTLLWSILMLSLIMYIFGICFLQIIAAHLSESTVQSVSDETLASIRLYWCSVYQSIVTLYYAVTGGADWEPLAAPIREAGEPYYCVFLFYIAFTAFAVLNVLTGLYVDTATKISEEDDNSVGKELQNREETVKFREMLYSLPSDKTAATPGGRTRTVKIESLEPQLKRPEAIEFLTMTETTASDLQRIFKILDVDDRKEVDVNALIDALLHTKGGNVSLDLIMISNELKRFFDTLSAFKENVQRRFDTMEHALSNDTKVGWRVAPAPAQPPWVPKSAAAMH